MDPNLARQRDDFKKSLKEQPVLPRICQPHSEIISDSSIIKTNMQSNSIDLSGFRHINSVVHSIISYLKSINRECDVEELKEELNIDLNVQSDLLEKIKLNERIEVLGSILKYRVSCFPLSHSIYSFSTNTLSIRKPIFWAFFLNRFTLKGLTSLIFESHVLRSIIISR